MKSMVTATIRLDLQTLLNMVEQREKSGVNACDDGASFMHDISVALYGLADKYGAEAVRKDRIREGRL